MLMVTRIQTFCLLFMCICYTVCSFLTVPQTQRTQLNQQIKIHKFFKACFIPKNCVDVQPFWIGNTPLFAATSSSSSDEYGLVESPNEETLQLLFAKECDSDGFMSKAAVQQLKSISDLLEDGDLLLEEFDEIWNAVTKSSGDSVEKINFELFLQIYKEIDDLFEDDDDDDGDKDDKELESSLTEQDISELEVAFETLCSTDSKFLTKDVLKQWSEIQQLLGDGMLGEDEFDDLWEQSPKNSQNPDQIDFKGFLSFNNALDDLFDFEDEEEGEDEQIENVESPAEAEKPKELPMVTGEDLPPAVIFANLSNGEPVIAKKDLKRWVELRVMLNDGDLLPEEFKSIYNQVPKAKGTTNKLDEAGFIALYEAIEELFEEIDEEEQAAMEKASAAAAKKEFLDLVDKVVATDGDTLPCGLECSDKEIESVVNAANSLEKESINLITQREGDISLEDLAGEWELIYSSSSTMKFNQGLSGLGGSIPNGKFAGLKQKLTYTKFLSDVEYLEKIEVLGGNSFDVKVTGNWELKRSVSLFTGAATIAMRVEPGMVSYGLTSMKADHWKSIGPLTLLDISYLDEDLRIMRGTTSTDTLFVFKRLA